MSTLKSNEHMFVRTWLFGHSLLFWIQKSTPCLQQVKLKQACRRLRPHIHLLQTRSLISATEKHWPVLWMMDFLKPIVRNRIGTGKVFWCSAGHEERTNRKKNSAPVLKIISSPLVKMEQGVVQGATALCTEHHVAVFSANFRWIALNENLYMLGMLPFNCCVHRSRKDWYGREKRLEGEEFMISKVPGLVIEWSIQRHWGRGVSKVTRWQLWLHD